MPEYVTAPAANRLSQGLALATLALLALTYLAWPSNAAEPAPAATRTPTRPTPPPSPSPRPNDDGTVRIVEHGFTVERMERDAYQITWGVIVENTSRTTAASVPVTLSLLDGKGRKLPTTMTRYVRDRPTAYIMPGARFGLGDHSHTYTRHPGTKAIKFELGAPAWLPPGDPRAPDLTATVLKTTPRQGRNDLDITFKVQARVQDVVHHAQANAILRNEQGEIVGGTSPSTTLPSLPPGWSIRRMKVHDAPSTADPARTEVHPVGSSS